MENRILVIYKNEVTEEIKESVEVIIARFEYKQSITSAVYAKIGTLNGDICDSVAYKLVVTVGGDGTFIYGAKIAHYLKVPVFGLFDGTLGFLTKTSPEKLNDMLYYNINLDVVEYKVLKTTFDGNSNISINDTVIKNKNTCKMLSYDLYVDNVNVGTFKGDGILISSPIGSTSYNLSMNGPIIVGDLDVTIINNIGTHTLFNRPIVVKSDSSIRIHVNDEAIVIVDGEDSNWVVPEDSHIYVKGDINKLQVTNVTDNSFFEVLSDKLHWAK